MNRTARNVLLGLGGVALATAGALTAASLYFYHLSVGRNRKKFLVGNPDLAPATPARTEDDPSISTGRATRPLSPRTAEKQESGDLRTDGKEASGTGMIDPADPVEEMSPPLSSKQASDPDDGAWLDAQATETWSISSEDGLTLVARWLPSGLPDNRVAVLAHGYSSRGRDMAVFARLFHSLGYHVLMPDARGHGDSGGDYIGFGWHDRLDIVQWAETVSSRYGGNCRMVLFGVSMGGATVMMAAGEPLPEQVRAIIEDCGYTSAHDQLAFQLKRMYHLPATPLLQTTSLVTRQLAGYGFSEASAVEQLRKATRPMLFIHGMEDRFVPTDMVHTLYEACPTEKELYLAEGAGHGLSYAVDPAAYRERVSTFLNRHVG